MQDAEEDAAEDEDEDDDEDMEEDGGRNHRYTLRDRSKVQVQPYVPGMGGGMLKRPGCAELLSFANSGWLYQFDRANFIPHYCLGHA